MPVALAPWFLVVEPGKKLVQEIIRDVQITNAALGDELQDPKGRTTLKISFAPTPTFDSDEEDEEEEKEQENKKATVPLCSLTPGSVSRVELFVA